MDPISIDTCSTSQSIDSEVETDAILHVLVIGFHHKKGSQVDYCYPPLNGTCYCLNRCPDDKNRDQHNDDDHGIVTSDDDDQLLPSEWKSLPSLSLPDGAHNFSADSVLFHLPMVQSCPIHENTHSKDCEDDQKTSIDPSKESIVDTSTKNKSNNIIYGVSCYRQIVASDSIKESDSSVTRTTVMKAVVVLSRLPYYGLINAKVDSICRVYFSQRNFNNKTCLHELYQNLNYVLSKDQRNILSPTEAKYLSLSPSRYLIQPFGHKLLVLIKLLLLERKILFFSTFNPNTSSTTISKSPVIGLRKVTSNKSMDTVDTSTNGQGTTPSTSKVGHEDIIDTTTSSSSPSSVRSLCLSILTLSSLIPVEPIDTKSKNYHLYCNHCQENDSIDVQSINKEDKSISDGQSTNISVTNESKELHDKNRVPLLSPKASLLPSINLFNSYPNSYHLYPYLDLSFIDSVKSYKSCLIGATNGLYKQKKSSLFDVVIDVVTGKIETENNDLKRCLQLTNEDLRFADFICKHSTSTPSNVSKMDLDTDTWEGSDDWIRIQVTIYLIHLIKTCLISEFVDNAKDVSSFGMNFVKSWKETNNYKEFKDKFFNDTPLSGDPIDTIVTAFGNIKSGHPFGRQSSGNVSAAMADLKLRLAASGYASSLFGTSTQKMTSTVTSSVGTSPSTSSAVDATSSSVKSAISSAKASLTNWYTSTIPSLNLVNNLNEEKDGEAKENESPQKMLEKDFQSVSLSTLLRNQELDSSYEVACDAVNELITFNPTKLSVGDDEEELITKSSSAEADQKK